MHARSHLRILVSVCALALAVLLPASPAAAGAGLGERPLEEGSHGKDVAQLQRLLSDFGFKTDVDGRFGPATKKSVKRYERSRDLKTNGVVSRSEARAMKRRARDAGRGKGDRGDKEEGKGDKGGKDSRRFGDRTLKAGARGADVRRLQELLTKLGFKTDIDGDFGPSTEKSLRAYERSRKMSVDGVVSKGQAERMRADADRSSSKGKSKAKKKDKPKGHPFGSRKLRSGKKGRDVRELQRVLDRLDIGTAVDGRFGPGTERSVRRYERWQKSRVDGLVPVPQGREMERKARRGARLPRKERKAGGGHAFPVRGPFSFGGEGSRFGAERGGRSHQGQDISATQGTPIVAVHRGRVATRAYQASGAGNYVVIHGNDGSDSVYMHMKAPGGVSVGEKVRAGERIGYVGNTGASFGAHLHFELWTPHWYAGGRPYDPLPKLKRWAR